MSSINQKLDYLLLTKYKIKDAIEQKDTAVNLNGVPFRDYPNYIRGLALRTGELFAFELSEDGKLVFTESTTAGAQTIQQYVSAKKWVLA